MANLKRYHLVLDPDDWDECGIVASPTGSFVKFEEAVEASSNNLQQLKAEIAAIVERLQRAYAMRESPDVLDCISELRQLSAV